MLYTNDGIYIVGLTGMSGAGKTTACDVFRAEGFGVINCDETARYVVEPGRPALSAIAGRFGTDMLLGDGSLDRRKLGSLVFSDSKALEALNGIIYPFITYRIINDICSYAVSDMKHILLDAPTLFESGADRLCDTIVCVTADRRLCAERIMKRDGITRGQAEDRLGSQHDAKFYISRSQYSIVNSGERAEFERELRCTAQKIRGGAGA